MELVNEKRQIIKNILTLDNYLHSANSDELQFAKRLIRDGICFTVYKQDNKVFFSPSRFVGYISNSTLAHIANKNKDGRDTNEAIESIYGFPPSPDESLEQQYREFCKNEGISYRQRAPFGVERKFWRI